jgi:hypothetical protein
LPSLKCLMMKQLQKYVLRSIHSAMFEPKHFVHTQKKNSGKLLIHCLEEGIENHLNMSSGIYTIANDNIDEFYTVMI